MCYSVRRRQVPCTFGLRGMRCMVSRNHYVDVASQYDVVDANVGPTLGNQRGLRAAAGRGQKPSLQICLEQAYIVTSVG